VTILEQLSVPLNAGRVITFSRFGDLFIITAIPAEFNGGLVPEDWRAESTSLVSALGEILGTWHQTPNDFQWDEIIEDVQKRKNRRHK
jgi:hypothetical protein